MKRTHNCFPALHELFGIKIIIVQLERQEDFYNTELRKKLKDEFLTPVYIDSPIAFVCCANGVTWIDIENSNMLTETKKKKLKKQIENLYPVNLKPIQLWTERGIYD